MPMKLSRCASCFSFLPILIRNMAGFAWLSSSQDRRTAQHSLLEAGTDARGTRHSVWKGRGLALLALLLCSAHGMYASGQVVAAGRLPPRLAVFGTYTHVQPNIGKPNNVPVWGGTVGGYMQTSYILGLDLRGSITRWGGREHQESILFGPRARFRVSHFSAYVEALGGPAHSWQPNIEGSYHVVDKISADITGIGGVDVQVRHRISLRGEAAYSRIFRNDPASLNALSLSAGVVYHFPR